MLKSEQNAIGFWALPKACWYLHTYTLFLAVLQDSKFQQTKLLLLNKFFCVNFPAHDQSQEGYVLFGILLQPALQPASITTQVRSDSKSGWKKQLPKCWNLQHFSTYPAFYLHFCERVKPPQKRSAPNKRRPTNPGALLAFLTSMILIHPSGPSTDVVFREIAPAPKKFVIPCEGNYLPDASGWWGILIMIASLYESLLYIYIYIYISLTIIQQWRFRIFSFIFVFKLCNYVSIRKYQFQVYFFKKYLTMFCASNLS